MNTKPLRILAFVATACCGVSFARGQHYQPTPVAAQPSSGLEQIQAGPGPAPAQFHPAAYAQPPVLGGGLAAGAMGGAMVPTMAPFSRNTRFSQARCGLMANVSGECSHDAAMMPCMCGCSSRHLAIR